MEHVSGFECCLATLFISKDQINPFLKMLADIRALKGFSVFSNKNMWVSLCPRRKNNIVDGLTTALLLAKIVAIDVLQKFGQTEKLWCQLTNISHVLFRSRQPGLLN
jgi:hypothetical protein